MTKTSGRSTKHGSKKCSNLKQDSHGEAKTEIPNFHKVIILLVTSRDRELVQQVCVEKLGLSEADARAAIEQALQEITLAADFDRREQIGKAVIRLEDIYEKSMRVQEQKNALATQKEISKLLGLYPVADQDTADTQEENSVLDEIREYLLPLELGKPEVSTLELVRLATYRIYELMGAHEKPGGKNDGRIPNKATRRSTKKS